MKIHSDKLTRSDFTEAARRAGVGIVKLDQRGSQSRQRAFDFYLTGAAGAMVSFPGGVLFGSGLYQAVTGR